MRENRPYGSEGGEPQLNAAFLPLSFVGCVQQVASNMDGPVKGVTVKGVKKRPSR